MTTAPDAGDRLFAREWADRLAIIEEPSGTAVTFGELETRSNQVAQFLRAQGVRTGDTVAMLIENRTEFLEIAWGAQRSGVYFVAVNTHLTIPEVAYIIEDCRPRVVFASATLADVAAAAVPDTVPTRVMIEPPQQYPEWSDYESTVRTRPTTPISDQREGDFMLYSSGTTGRPKAIARPLPGGPLGTYLDRPGMWLTGSMGFHEGDVFLSPAPLYHAAPLAWCMSVHRHGGTAVVMESFDAAHALELIELHHVTHSQWVPTMFVRLLKLDSHIRERHDLSSHRAAIHAAAPCPVAAKQAILDWWGPIVFEFYSNTEGVGATFITAEEWLAHPGSVGRPVLGSIVITDDAGNALPSGEVGSIWFADTPAFEYRGDPGRTAAALDTQGRATVGDMGYLDQEGYLYLSARRTDLVISGGVNVYPREIEDVLVMHPAVRDAAVVGMPDPDLGEVVGAYVELADPTADSGVAQDLIRYCRSRLAGIKVPRTIRFLDRIPRTPTGKVRKHELPQPQR